MIKIFPQVEQKIVTLYVKKKLSCREIKEELGLNISVRQIQRRLGKLGVIRKPGEAFALAVTQGKVTYYRKPKSLNAPKTVLSTLQRHRVLSRDEFRCQDCGNKVEDGIRLEVVFKNGNILDKRDDNLHSLCNLCRLGRQRSETAY